MKKHSDIINTLKLFSNIEVTDEKKIKKIKLKCISSYYPIPNNNLIAKVEEKTNCLVLTAFSSYVSVKAVLINEDGETFLRLEFNNRNGKAEQDFSASILCSRGIKQLLKYNVVFNEKGGSNLVDYLLRQQANAPVINLYSDLGWCRYENELAFKYDYMYVKDGYYEEFQYGGEYSFESEGDYRVWEKMIIKEVCGNIPLEFILALGFSSPVLSLLDETHDFGAMLFNLSNSTSKGKTTAAMLAASIFGKPVTGNSTMLSYNATKNALTEAVAKFNGITVAVDEAAILKSRGFSTLLYTLCSGTTKGRIQSTKGGIKLGKVKHFSTVILSTAEFDLLNAYSEGGLKVRVFEINDTFTTSSENSTNIKNIASANYGEAGISFIMHLLENHCTDMEEGYAAVVEELKKEITTKTDITDRLIERFAVILLTVKYCNDCEYFSFTLNYKSLFDYTVKLIQDIDYKLNYEERIKDIILEDYSMNNYAYYPYEENKSQIFIGGKIRGYVNFEEDYSNFYIMPSVFKQLMNNEGIFEVNKILSPLRASGILLTEGKDHLKKRIYIQDKPRLPVYHFRFKREEKDM